MSNLRLVPWFALLLVSCTNDYGAFEIADRTQSDAGGEAGVGGSAGQAGGAGAAGSAGDSGSGGGGTGGQAGGAGTAGTAGGCNGGPECTSGDTCCGSVGCRNLQTDESNCGRCGHGCFRRQICVNGQCV